MDYFGKEIKSKIIIKTPEFLKINKRRNTNLSCSLSSISGLRKRGGFAIKGINAKRSRSVAFSETRSVRSRKNSKVSFGGKSRKNSTKNIIENVPVPLIPSPKSQQSFTKERK